VTAGQITNFEALGRRFASGGFEPRLSSALPGFVDRTEDRCSTLPEAGRGAVVAHEEAKAHQGAPGTLSDGSR
jgi:hypothetical protein